MDGLRPQSGSGPIVGIGAVVCLLIPATAGGARQGVAGRDGGGMGGWRAQGRA